MDIIPFSQIARVRERDGESALDGYKVVLLDPLDSNGNERRNADGSPASSTVIARQAEAKVAAGFRVP